MVEAGRQPWLKWYPSDWRSDPRLRMCSVGARGLWIELLGLMHEADPYGHLAVNGLTPTPTQIATLVGGTTVREVDKFLEELENSGVFSRNNSGVIFSRRMVRDRAKQLKDKENGAKGGNPAVKAGVNPQDKAHMPEARTQSQKSTTEPDTTTEFQLETPSLIPTAPQFDFEMFYRSFPIKKARGKAERAWRAAIKLHPPELIIAAARRYAAEKRGKDPQFIKHPATWLNAKCWEDEPEPERKDQGAIDAIKAFVTGDIKNGFPAHDAIDRLVEAVALPAPAGVVRKAGED